MSLCRAERATRRQQGREQNWDLPEQAGVNVEICGVYI